MIDRINHPAAFVPRTFRPAGSRHDEDRPAIAPAGDTLSRQTFASQVLAEAPAHLARHAGTELISQILEDGPVEQDAWEELFGSVQRLFAGRRWMAP